MTTYAEFYGESDWEQSSGPLVNRKFEEDVLWPIADNSGSGTKDALADGLHPVVAIGGRTAADGRANNRTGVVVTYNATSDIAVVNIADGYIVRNYVSNIAGYDGQNAANAWEAAPVIGQPVYIDDSDDLGAGCTLSMSPLNDAGVDNPLAGHLMYCQDEYVDYAIGGSNSDQWGPTWLGSTAEYLVCVMLTSAVHSP